MCVTSPMIPKSPRYFLSLYCKASLKEVTRASAEMSDRKIDEKALRRKKIEVYPKTHDSRLYYECLCARIVRGICSDDK